MRRFSWIIALTFAFSLLPLDAAAQLGDLKRGLDKLKAAKAAAKTSTEQKRAGSTSPGKASSGGPDFEDGTMMLWVKPGYSWENPLHTELSINGRTVNIFTSETFEPVGQYLQEGWNTFTLHTVAQEPANEDNGLTFLIGPAYHDAKKRSFVMKPVLWRFDNNSDWKRQENGTYSHPLGPQVKDVTLTIKVYWAGLGHEAKALNAGDFILQGEPNYKGWNSPVTGTVFINGTPLNTFLAERDVVITPFLRKGKNEIKIVSTRSDNVLADNDIEFSIAGPAEWIVDRGEYEVKPVVQFKSMQGWTKDRKSGKLVNRSGAESDTIERTIAFMIKDEQAN